MTPKPRSPHEVHCRDGSGQPSTLRVRAEPGMVAVDLLPLGRTVYLPSSEAWRYVSAIQLAAYDAARLRSYAIEPPQQHRPTGTHDE